MGHFQSFQIPLCDPLIFDIRPGFKSIDDMILGIFVGDDAGFSNHIDNLLKKFTER